MTKTIIEMPEDERQRFISEMDGVFGQAEEYADECVRLLIDVLGVNEASVQRDVFSDVAISQICNDTLTTPHKRVREAICQYKLRVLGLDEVTVDRTMGTAAPDSEVIVCFQNGEIERFFVRGLSDYEYIRRAVLLRLGAV